MNLEPSMACQPGLDLGMFVRGVIVSNEMHREIGGNLLIEWLRKPINS
jgi:hypothetical protein